VKKAAIFLCIAWALLAQLLPAAAETEHPLAAAAQNALAQENHVSVLETETEIQLYFTLRQDPHGRTPMTLYLFTRDVFAMCAEIAELLPEGCKTVYFQANADFSDGDSAAGPEPAMSATLSANSVRRVADMPREVRLAFSLKDVTKDYWIHDAFLD